MRPTPSAAAGPRTRATPGVRTGFPIRAAAFADRCTGVIRTTGRTSRLGDVATTTRLRPPENRVSPRSVRMWTLQSAVGSAVLLALLCAAVWGVRWASWAWIPDWGLRNAWWIPVLYAVYGLASTVVVPQWRYRVHRWEITADVVYTRSGWVSRQWQLVPISRIQTVDHRQGWLERLFRVATLEVQTASHAGSSTIEGLGADDAKRFSVALADRAEALRADATCTVRPTRLPRH